MSGGWGSNAPWRTFPETSASKGDGFERNECNFPYTKKRPTLAQRLQNDVENVRLHDSNIIDLNQEFPVMGMPWFYQNVQVDSKNGYERRFLRHNIVANIIDYVKSLRKSNPEITYSFNDMQTSFLQRNEQQWLLHLLDTEYSGILYDLNPDHIPSNVKTLIIHSDVWKTSKPGVWMKILKKWVTMTGEGIDFHRLENIVVMVPEKGTLTIPKSPNRFKEPWWPNTLKHVGFFPSFESQTKSLLKAAEKCQEILPDVLRGKLMFSVIAIDLVPERVSVQDSVHDLQSFDLTKEIRKIVKNKIMFPNTDIIWKPTPTIWGELFFGPSSFLLNNVDDTIPTSCTTLIVEEFLLLQFVSSGRLANGITLVIVFEMDTGFCQKIDRQVDRALLTRHEEFLATVTVKEKFTTDFMRTFEGVEDVIMFRDFHEDCSLFDERVERLFEENNISVKIINERLARFFL